MQPIWIYFCYFHVNIGKSSAFYMLFASEKIRENKLIHENENRCHLCDTWQRTIWHSLQIHFHRNSMTFSLKYPCSDNATFGYLQVFIVMILSHTLCSHGRPACEKHPLFIHFFPYFLRYSMRSLHGYQRTDSSMRSIV